MSFVCRQMRFCDGVPADALTHCSFGLSPSLLLLPWRVFDLIERDEMLPSTLLRPSASSRILLQALLVFVLYDAPIVVVSADPAAVTVKVRHKPIDVFSKVEQSNLVEIELDTNIRNSDFEYGIREALVDHVNQFPDAGGRRRLNITFVVDAPRAVGQTVRKFIFAAAFNKRVLPPSELTNDTSTFLKSLNDSIFLKDVIKIDARPYLKHDGLESSTGGLLSLYTGIGIVMVVLAVVAFWGIREYARKARRAAAQRDAPH